MFATQDAPAEKGALPVKEDPLADCRDGILRLIERRKLRLQAVFCKGHAEVSRVDNNHY